MYMYKTWKMGGLSYDLRSGQRLYLLLEVVVRTTDICWLGSQGVRLVVNRVAMQSPKLPYFICVPPLHASRNLCKRLGSW